MSHEVVQVSSLVAVRIELFGLVQGVGMRPFVARLANELSVCGFVCNDEHGVEIHAEATSKDLEHFIARLKDEFPCCARVDRIRRTTAAVVQATDFAIQHSPASAFMATRVPVDVCMCDSCRSEVMDPDDRRYLYPFTTCTSCGPRYSLVETMPFDRERTTMQPFRMCSECEKEYRDTDDRRFHSQTNCCPACGPDVLFHDGQAANDRFGIEAVRAAAAAIQKGLIVAVKGVGGYQFVCDATSSVAVMRLRERKQRPRKPLAVMVKSVDEAREFAHVSGEEASVLAAAENAIVLLASRRDQERCCDSLYSRDNGLVGTSSRCSWLRPALPLAAEVSPNLGHVGIMLPTSPLHLLLLQQAGVPCVVTSGNRNDEPLAFQNAVAEETLQAVADVWLHHDRLIVRPIDDSVVRVINRQSVTIRAARGIAPMSLNVKSGSTILAVGGQQKVALAISSDQQAVLGPHIGDMTSVAARHRFVEHAASTCLLYMVSPAVIAHDMHPDYFTTRWAHDQGKKAIAVQHHHAHIAAGMLEHRWLNHEVLGVAFDGTGYGTDGTIWGGEFLLCTATSFRRVARLRPFPLIGGDVAVREPWRIAAALLNDAGADLTVLRECTAKNRVSDILPASRLSSLTSSMGRLFDAVASLLLNIDEVSYEGEAAMRLEAVCDVSADGHYDLHVVDGEVVELDWRPMIRDIVTDMRAGVATGSVAMRFVRGIALATATICRRFPKHRIVLSGGCFQNAILTCETTEALEDHPMAVGLPRRIPPNDGGLAAGQLAVAAATLAASDNNEGVF